jgi:hypothetical protein
LPSNQHIAHPAIGPFATDTPASPLLLDFLELLAQALHSTIDRVQFRGRGASALLGFLHGFEQGCSLSSGTAAVIGGGRRGSRKRTERAA